ncbi:hypothetical protein DL89DRAFT_282609 [Linderina pennispora]|uniref:Uncharacterized protein n=1 Tax=Linderina pennispora TaxID=61395 RepID=A0A1Y1WC67_9FUNG|nr:uncharacterized protein DL89DRAFT_282609 [Linderina pennispora]ORX71129.1 hypothetical protein DL89DRAFT_282609 [Linderina pennispora]
MANNIPLIASGNAPTQLATANDPTVTSIPMVQHSHHSGAAVQTPQMAAMATAGDAKSCLFFVWHYCCQQLHWLQIWRESRRPWRHCIGRGATALAVAAVWGVCAAAPPWWGCCIVGMLVAARSFAVASWFGALPEATRGT